SFQLLRTLGSTYYGGADIGECLSTAYRIKEGDFESWHSEWLATAERVSKYGDNSLSSGHKVSAREAYLRAFNYYRNAEFFLHTNPQDRRIIETWQKSVDSFKKAAQLLPNPVEFVEIPYEGTSLPGYFYKVDDKYNTSSSPFSKPKPTLILHTGFDGTQEELYVTSVIAALSRGYNCLTFEGPGQGRVIRKQKIPFRYDWEKVVTPVIDFVARNYEAECDIKRLALMGISMGGYLAARAVAFEHRIAACILDDGVYDIYENYMEKLGTLGDAITQGNATVVNTAIETSMYFDTTIRWAISHGMWSFNAKDPLDLIRKNKDYTLKGVADNIECPTLVLEAQMDDDFPGGPKKVYNALKCPKKYVLFTAEEGAEDHCQVAALSLSNQRIFDWLDGEVFKSS
ncbi:MAG TPA: alpha/beta fold hydrolase, partial [Nitrososphaeraceae archaeon]|nr:alpha/beta fold hydrolase [Nitrososphaeraceae archaeon]